MFVLMWAAAVLSDWSKHFLSSLRFWFIELCQDYNGQLLYKWTDASFFLMSPSYNSRLPCRALSNSMFNIVQEEISINLWFWDYFLKIPQIQDQPTFWVPSVALPSFRLYADVTAHMRMFGFSGFCLRGELFMLSALCKARGGSELRAEITSVFKKRCHPDKTDVQKHKSSFVSVQSFNAYVLVRKKRQQVASLLNVTINYEIWKCPILTEMNSIQTKEMLLNQNMLLKNTQNFKLYIGSKVVHSLMD